MTYNEETIKAVREKGNKIPNFDPNQRRKDQCGARIGKSYYGNRESEYGREIDHITPKSKGGGDELSNLRPLQWANNLEKSDGRLVCKVGDNNLYVR